MIRLSEEVIRKLYYKLRSLVHVPDVSITDLSVYLEQSKWYRGY
jgi:hypothetical protein